MYIILGKLCRNPQMKWETDKIKKAKPLIWSLLKTALDKLIPKKETSLGS